MDMPHHFTRYGKDNINYLAPREQDCMKRGNKVMLDQTYLNSKHEILNSKQYQMTKFKMFETNNPCRDRFQSAPYKI